MKENIKLKGIVTARNVKTGEIIFEKQNCIVEGGRLVTLAKSIGLSKEEFGNIKTENAGLQLSKFDPNNLKITRYRAGTTDTVSTDYGVCTTDTDISCLLEDENSIFAEGNVEYFIGSDEERNPEDIPDDQNDVKIVNIEAADTAFIRIKIRLKTPGYYTTSEEDPWNNYTAGSSPDVTQVNELALFMQEDGSDDMLMFSKLKFPVINFFSTMEIEFEYRIYG